MILSNNLLRNEDVIVNCYNYHNYNNMDSAVKFITVIKCECRAVYLC